MSALSEIPEVVIASDDWWTARCPRCGSQNIVADPLDWFDSDEVMELVRCSDCGTGWHNCYHYRESIFVVEEDEQ